MRQIASSHPQKCGAATFEEYLSGLRLEDKITPVTTLVISFGSRKWNGPLSLHAMCAEQSEHILRLIPEYRVLLIGPMSMTDEALRALSGSLREVLSYINISDQEQMQRRCIRMSNSQHWSKMRRW